MHAELGHAPAQSAKLDRVVSVFAAHDMVLRVRHGKDKADTIPLVENDNVEIFMGRERPLEQNHQLRGIRAQLHGAGGICPGSQVAKLTSLGKQCCETKSGGARMNKGLKILGTHRF